MKILFRVDANLKIGSGHLMRAMTLATEAQRRGWKTCFVLRDADVYTLELVKSSGSDYHVFVSNTDGKHKNADNLLHSDWLSVSQETDANDTLGVVSEFEPDWIVIDHYALDIKWISIIKKIKSKILVVDDLGDRNLICDLLLNQNLGAQLAQYRGKVSENCRLLLGPKYALLRNEFSQYRAKNLAFPYHGKVHKVLITMGGADEDDYTQKTLKVLEKSNNAEKCVFTVVTGGSYPHTDTLKYFLKSSRLNVSVLSKISNMAEIMSDTDLCIGAAGSTSWERCCLGIPSITFSIAANQIAIAKQLSEKSISIYSNLEKLRLDFDRFFEEPNNYLQRNLSLNASRICDGLGTSRVVSEMECCFEN